MSIFDRFRDPSSTVIRADAWPRMYGDDFEPNPQFAQTYLSVTGEQYRQLSEWAAGNFSADWDPNAVAPRTLRDIAVHEQPGALDRAALEACSGGPFHPGEEATWPMRHASLYSGFCRVRMRRATDPPEPDYGQVLTPKKALGPKGPIHRSGPGDITRWR